MVLFGAAELMSRVPEWLKTAGLAPFIPNFNNCEEDEFLGLQVYPVPFQSRKRKTAMTAVLAQSHEMSFPRTDARLCKLQHHFAGGPPQAVFSPPGS
jgi:hypothetical protein